MRVRQAQRQAWTSPVFAWRAGTLLLANQCVQSRRPLSFSCHHQTHQRHNHQATTQRIHFIARKQHDQHDQHYTCNPQSLTTPETSKLSRRGMAVRNISPSISHTPSVCTNTEMQQPPSQPRAYSQAYLPNGGAQQPSGPVPGARPLDPNQGRVQQLGHARVLCIADVRGTSFIGHIPVQ